MKVGDLVTMDYVDWSGIDEWGIGIIVEIAPHSPEEYCVVHWSKLGALSWESHEMLVSVNETR